MQSYQLLEGQAIDSHSARCLGIVHCLPGTVRQVLPLGVTLLRVQ